MMEMCCCCCCSSNQNKENKKHSQAEKHSRNCMCGQAGTNACYFLTFFKEMRMNNIRIDNKQT